MDSRMFSAGGNRQIAPDGPGNASLTCNRCAMAAGRTEHQKQSNKTMVCNTR
jgi:hypothetical protein